jgi:hypothetical protein
MTTTDLPFRPAPADLRETDRLVAARLLDRVVLDVVVAPGPAPDRALRADALRLLVPDRLRERGAVVVEGAAAWLWGGGPPPGYVDVSVLPGTLRVTVPHLVRHERWMPADDTVPVLGRSGEPVLVSTPARTAADLLRTAPETLADRAARDVVAATGAAPAEIAACLARMPRARGVARARLLLGRWPSP